MVNTTTDGNKFNIKEFLSRYYRLNSSIGNGSSAATLMSEAQDWDFIESNRTFAEGRKRKKLFASLLNSGARLSSFERQLVVRQILEST